MILTMTGKELSTLAIAAAPGYTLISPCVLAGIGFVFVGALPDTMLFNEGTVRMI